MSFQNFFSIFALVCTSLVYVNPALAELVIPKTLKCTATEVDVLSKSSDGKEITVEIINSDEEFSVFTLSNGKKTPFIKGDIFCGKYYEVDSVERICDTKTNLSSSSYSRDRNCSDIIPNSGGRSAMSFRTDYYINSHDGKSYEGGTGRITCIVNQNGFSYLDIKGCTSSK